MECSGCSRDSNEIIAYCLHCEAKLQARLEEAEEVCNTLQRMRKGGWSWYPIEILLDEWESVKCQTQHTVDK